MKNTVGGGLAALGIAGAMATTVMAAVPAHATISTVGDPDDYSGYNYAVELSLVGLSETPSQAAYMAHTICLDRERGFSEDFIVTDGTANDGLTSEQAVEGVMGGEYHFCHMFEADGSIGGGHSSPGPVPGSPGISV